MTCGGIGASVLALQFSLEIPDGFFEVFLPALLKVPPNVFDRVPATKIHVFGNLNALNARRVSPVVAGVYRVLEAGEVVDFRLPYPVITDYSIGLT
jgi:hypothetical protein